MDLHSPLTLFYKQQFRRIEWAIRNSRSKDKKKLDTWYNQLLTFVMSFWLKKFSKENKLSDSGKKMFKTIYGEKVKRIANFTV